MKEIPADKFKKCCLAVMAEVQDTGEPVIVTKDGKALVKLVPAKMKEESIFGYMAGKAKIVGDIVSSVTPLKDWKALK